MTTSTNAGKALDLSEAEARLGRLNAESIKARAMWGAIQAARGAAAFLDTQQKPSFPANALRYGWAR